MIRLNFTFILSCFLIIAVASAACAQWEDDEANRFGIGVAMFRPSDGDLADITGSIWFGPVVSYSLKLDAQNRPTSVVALGFLGEESGGIKGSLIPLTYTFIKRFDKGQASWFTGGGLGIYRTKVTAFSESESSTKLGLNLVAGRDFSSGAFVELRYDLIPKKSEVFSYSGLSIDAGFRQSF